jgi:hypothetical protein
MCEPCCRESQQAGRHRTKTHDVDLRQLEKPSERRVPVIGSDRDGVVHVFAVRYVVDNEHALDIR